MDNREFITRRVAKELKDGDVVNLGIGMPTMVANYIPEGVNIILQSENGSLNVGPRPKEGEEDPTVSDAGGQPSSVLPGGMFFDSATSFMIIRGGHVNATVLGALEVDEKGNLANWIIPGKLVPGMGGAMDLVTGAQKVILAMEHTNKGRHKILKECSLPLTAVEVVDLIVTEMGVMEITEDGIVLVEINEDYTLDEIKEATGAELIISDDLKPMEI